MSLIRTGHKPDDWRDEGASSALIRHQASVSAEPIGNMRPVIAYPGRMSEARREQAREASRRYRARVR